MSNIPSSIFVLVYKLFAILAPPLSACPFYNITVGIYKIWLKTFAYYIFTDTFFSHKLTKSLSVKNGQLEFNSCGYTTSQCDVYTFVLL